MICWRGAFPDRMHRAAGGISIGTVAEALAWQIGVWDQMAPVYIREIDKRFAPVVEHLIGRAQLKPGQHVLDLGTRTGSVALRAAPAIAPNGHVTAVDISAEMLGLARQRAAGQPEPTSASRRAGRRRCRSRVKASMSSWRVSASCT